VLADVVVVIVVGRHFIVTFVVGQRFIVVIVVGSGYRAVVVGRHFIVICVVGRRFIVVIVVLGVLADVVVVIVVVVIVCVVGVVVGVIDQDGIIAVAGISIPVLDVVSRHRERNWVVGTSRRGDKGGRRGHFVGDQSVIISRDRDRDRR